MKILHSQNGNSVLRNANCAVKNGNSMLRKWKFWLCVYHGKSGFLWCARPYEAFPRCHVKFNSAWFSTIVESLNIEGCLLGTKMWSLALKTIRWFLLTGSATGYARYCNRPTIGHSARNVWSFKTDILSWQVVSRQGCWWWGINFPHTSFFRSPSTVVHYS